MHSIQQYLLLFTFCLVSGLLSSLHDNLNRYCILPHGSENFKFPRREYRLNVSDSHYIYFSICDSLESVGCDSSSACIQVNGAFINAGKKFIIDSKTDKSQSIRSVGGDKCSSNSDGSKAYSLNIELTCTESSQIEPNYVSHSDCEYTINMMRFDCEPYCTKRENDYLIDLRPLRSHVTITSEETTFALSVCDTDSRCGKGVSTCEILPDGYLNYLSLAKSEQIMFQKEKNSARNSVMIKGKYGEKERNLRFFKLHVVCNWETDSKDWHFIKKQTQGRYYDFQVQSKHGCVKLHDDCIIDHEFSHMRYNLRALYRKQGWSVKNVTEGEILLNICGDLKLSRDSNVCSDYQAQVCEIKDRKYVSKGSSVFFEIKSDYIQGIISDYVQGTISDGSVCKEDPARNYETIITFLCYPEDIGPVFVRHDGCTLHLEWKSPQACGYYHSSNIADCHVNDEFGSRNLNDLSQDLKYSLSGKSILTYNICGSIKSSCGTYRGNVSACLSNSSGSFVVGWLNRQIVSENQTLILNLEGEECQDSVNSRTVVNFTCSRTHSRRDIISESPEACTYNINVHSPLACVTQTTYKLDCEICGKDECYDLNPLARNSSNYLVKNPALPKIDFFLNMCASIVNEYDLKCHNSMVCVRNQTEINILHRYHSLGSMNKLVLSDDGLILETTSGSDCNGDYYKSIFHFVCSENEADPELQKYSKCTFEFSWHTKFACGKKKCNFQDKLGKTINLDACEKKNFNISLTEDNYYEFNICSNYYERFFEGKKEYFKLERHMEEDYLILTTGLSCSNNTSITRVEIKLICEPLFNNDHIEHISLDNCIARINLNTNAVCSNEVATNLVTETAHYVTSAKTIHHVTMKTIEHIAPTYIPEVKPLNNRSLYIPEVKPLNNRNLYTPEVKPLNNRNLYLHCNISDSSSERFLLLSTFEPLNFTVDDIKYSITWSNYQDDEHTCNNIEFHRPQNSVDIYFTTNLSCSSGHFKIKTTLQCEKSKSLTKLTSERVDKCLLSSTYLVPDICIFMNKETIKISKSDIIGILVGILIILIAVGGYYYLRNRLKKESYDEFHEERIVIYNKQD